jgi:hypothetical protein
MEEGLREKLQAKKRAWRMADAWRSAKEGRESAALTART